MYNFICTLTQASLLLLYLLISVLESILVIDSRIATLKV